MIFICENMMQNKNKIRKNKYYLGIPLGLNYKDVYEILNHSIPEDEQSSISAGPSIYCGTWYGTVSIYDF
jgi:hypothetical protein